jgi:RNA polymerase sigma-B factor
MSAPPGHAAARRRRPPSGPGTNRTGGRRRAPTHEDRAAENQLLAAYARTRDPALLEELVQRFMPLARRLAARCHGGREPYEDLVQVACVGLVNALGRFDPERGFAFSSFAAPTILGELRRHFRDRGWSVHVERALQERTATVERALAELPSRLGRSPSVAEVAERTNLTPEEVLEAMEAAGAHHAASLDMPLKGKDGESSSLLERLPSEEASYELVEYGASIESALASLPERDRYILHLRFVEDRTQTEIATRVGCSQMHISRILRATIDKLRAAAGSSDRPGRSVHAKGGNPNDR